MTTTHEVLVKARNRLAVGVWSQGMTYDERTGGRCALGHLSEAAILANPVTGYSKIYFACERALARDMPNGPSNIPAWNDAPGRTKEEVLALFDKAIAQTAPAPDTSFLTEVREEVPA